MSITGKLIKTAIDLGSDLLEHDHQPEEKQQEVLRQLLDKAKDTAFGKYYGFESIRRSDDPVAAFKKAVPTFDYDRMKEAWWHRTIEGIEDIAWPGSPDHFALSSGTTGSESKRIPVTQDMIDTIKDTGIKQIMSLSHHELPDEFFDKEIMMLGSSTDLQEVDGHYEGEISGISASNIPFWFKGYYKPGEEIAAIEDWDARVQRIAEKASEWDIGALSGIPSWIELMLKKVIEHNKLNTIHDIWPNLSVYTSGGVAFDAYRKSFEEHLERPLLYLDTYLASEGFIAYQSRPNDNMAMQLAYEGGIYFEFIPFEEQYFDEKGSPLPDAPAFSLAEVEEGIDYALLISTVSGAWRYSIGDTIVFTDKSRAEIKITGRTKHFLNVVGSQLSVAKMNAGVQHLEQKFNVSIPEFTVGAVKSDGLFHHQWFLGSDDYEQADEESMADAIDEKLKSLNKNYRVARGKALKGVKVEVVPTQVFHDWSERNKKKGGQIKTARMMDEEDLNAFGAFAHEGAMS
ncbi:MAG: GH3 auxin-responsive promoter family protein [Roseivirga sp.]